MSGISDTTMATAALAMRGLATRADVRAHNLANVNTPGFRAGRVDFESSLRQALASGRLDDAEPVVTVDPNLPGPNQNTVSPEGEMVGQMQDNLLRSAMVQAFNFKQSALRTAMGAA